MCAAKSPGRPVGEVESVRTEIFERTAMSKPKLQARMASLSFSEKVKVLEKLRDREKAIAAAGLRQAVPKGSQKCGRP